MPSRHAVLGLVAVAVLGLATGCEKPSPYITLTAHGVVVKVHAQKYCRGGKCVESSSTAVLEIHNGDLLGIDVPRSVAEDGWRLGADGAFSHKHYETFPVNGAEAGRTIPLQIQRDESHGIGQWLVTLKVK